MTTDEDKARALVAAAQDMGMDARTWWDRGPYAAQLFLTDDHGEYAPSLLVYVEDADDYKLLYEDGTQFGWRWHGALLGYEDHHMLEGLGEGVTFEILERNHIGDNEVTVAAYLYQLVLLLRNGAKDLDGATLR